MRKNLFERLKKLFRLFFLFFFLDGVLFVGILFFVFFLIFVIGNYDEVNRMSLRHLKFGVTFMAAENFAFFHFVFVQIDFGVAFRTSGH
jgi:hypothetical protein